jgi:thioredoxin 1
MMAGGETKARGGGNVPTRIGGRPTVGAALLAAAILALAAGGCGASKFKHISETVTEFQAHVIQADQPVLVEFFKGGCPTCWMLEATLDQLADEYAGRMKFVSFEMMRPYFAVTCPEIQKRHRIAYYPTIILFIKSEEKHRWVLEYGIERYREVLNEIVNGPVAQTQDVGKPDVTKADVEKPHVKKPDKEVSELREFLCD